MEVTQPRLTTGGAHCLSPLVNLTALPGVWRTGSFESGARFGSAPTIPRLKARHAQLLRDRRHDVHRALGLPTGSRGRLFRR